MIEFDLHDNGNTDECDADGSNDQDAKLLVTKMIMNILLLMMT